MNIRKPSLALPLLPIIAGLCMQASSSVASPLVSIGDNADLYFNGSSSLRWTSNVFRDEYDDKDDLIWTVSPGFELNVGRGLSNADLSIITRYDIIRYEDNDQLDSELFHIKAMGSYRASRLDLNGWISFDEEKNNSGDVNVDDDLIETDNFGAALEGEYRLSPKFSIGSGVIYRDKEYQSPYDDRFADRESYRLPVDVFYELTPKVDLSLGYSYTHTEIEDTYNPNTLQYVSSYDTESHFFNVGARGNLLPKLTGFFKVGYRVSSKDDSRVVSDPDGANIPLADVDRDDDGILGLDGNLTWAATPKLTVGTVFSRDFGVGGEGQSTENSSVDVTASYAISTHISANANVGYTYRDYTDSGREDDQYQAGLGMRYSPNQYWSFGTGYFYTENDSNKASESYEDHSLNVSATLRY